MYEIAPRIDGKFFNFKCFSKENIPKAEITNIVMYIVGIPRLSGSKVNIIKLGKYRVPVKPSAKTGYPWPILESHKGILKVLKFSESICFNGRLK